MELWDAAARLRRYPTEVPYMTQPWRCLSRSGSTRWRRWRRSLSLLMLGGVGVNSALAAGIAVDPSAAPHLSFNAGELAVLAIAADACPA